MGFSLSSALGGAISGFLVGGPTGAVVGGIAGGFAGGGDTEKAKVSFAQAPELEQTSAARAELFGLATGELPKIPTREIAGIPGTTATGELARETLVAGLEPQEQIDFLNQPDVQALIQRTIEEGNLIANRVGRTLQRSGNIESTTGRDILGRTVKQVESNIIASLAPSFEAQRGRAFSERGRILELAKVLEGLELSDSERTRLIQQAENDADFAQQLETVLQPFKLKRSLLESVIGLQPTAEAVITGGGAKDPLGGFGDIIGPLLSSVLNKKDKE